MPGADPEYAGMYLHARYYDPKLGIFLSPDPIGPAGGTNLYGYGGGDPINSADPSGLSPWCWSGPYPGSSFCLSLPGGSPGGSPGGAPGGGPPHFTDGTTVTGTPGGTVNLPGPLGFIFGAIDLYGSRIADFFGFGPPGNSSIIGPNPALPQLGPPQDRGAYMPDHPTGPPVATSTAPPGGGDGPGGPGGPGGGGNNFSLFPKGFTLAWGPSTTPPPEGLLPRTLRETAPFLECGERYGFSNTVRGVGGDAAGGAAAMIEVAGPLSLGGDLLAVSAKHAGSGVYTPEAYASGMNWVFRRTAQMLRNPRLQGRLTSFGNKATVPMAIFGALTFGYNTTIDAQCAAGLLR